MDDFLAIYLRDQLALGVAWRELAQRAESANRGTDLGRALATVRTDIADDVRTFESVMRRIGIRPNPVKTALAVVAERVGRAKLNGRLRGYSPLSRFVELEFLIMGIEGKKQLWTTLRDLAGLGERLPDVDFEALIGRAHSQRATLEPFRVRYGTEVLRPTHDRQPA
jgi:hypothetical protein